MNNFPISQLTIPEAVKDSIECAIENYGEKFTRVIDTISDIKSSIVLISFESSEKILSYVGYLTKSQKVATGQIRIKVSDIIEVEELYIKDIIPQITVKSRNKVQDLFKDKYKLFSTVAANNTIKALCELRPEIKKYVSQFKKKLSFKYTQSALAEKDAVGICLDIFGLDRNSIQQTCQNGDSFLNNLKEYTAYEDDIISKDLNNFPGYSKIKDSIAGVAEFQNKKGEKLVIINTNRKSLEKDFGTDLIYFNRQYNAFTFIQYKMMDCTTKNNDSYYNPNQQTHEDELERMNALLTQKLSKHSIENSLADYRMSNCPIFFKLCKKFTSQSDNFSIVSGAYLPLDQWNILIKDTSTNGLKGGKQIGYHTLSNRYLGTGDFVELVKKGYVGTYNLDSNKLAKFIENRIKHGSSVIYAVDNRNEIRT